MDPFHCSWGRIYDCNETICWDDLLKSNLSHPLLLLLRWTGELERGCMPATSQQWLLLALALIGSCFAGGYWLHAHFRMLQKHGPEGAK